MLLVSSIRRPPIASAQHGLSLLRDELNRGILTTLAEMGPLNKASLARWLLVPRTTVGERLDDLMAGDVVEALGSGRGRTFALTSAAPGLIEAIGVVERWLRGNPERPLESSSPVGWRAFAVLAASWRTVLVEWIVRCAPTQADLAKGFDGFTERQLKDDIGSLVGIGMFELRCDRNGQERYRLTHWGRRAIGILAFIARWERMALPEACAPIEVDDALVALLALLPLVRLSEPVSGLCTFSAEVDPGDDAERRAVLVTARVSRGRVVACAEGPPSRGPDAWAAGPFGAWLAAVLDGKTNTLRCEGTEGNANLARSMVAQIHQELFRSGGAGQK
jgi:DNA-binding HxlR family transcriptional regulator